MTFPDIIHKFNHIVIVLPLEKYPQFDEIAKPLSENLQKTTKKNNITTLVETAMDLNKILKNEANDYSTKTIYILF